MDYQTPRAWMMVNKKYGLTPSLHWEPQNRRDVTWQAEPLFDKAALDAAVDAEREQYTKEIERLRADRDLEKKWRKDAEHDREELIAAAVLSELGPLRHNFDRAIKLADDRLAQMKSDRAEALRWRDRVARAPMAILDTRTALGLCAPTKADFPALYALQGRKVALVDLGATAVMPATSAPLT